MQVRFVNMADPSTTKKGTERFWYNGLLIVMAENFKLIYDMINCYVSRNAYLKKKTFLLNLV